MKAIQKEESKSKFLGYKTYQVPGHLLSEFQQMVYENPPTTNHKINYENHIEAITINKE